jgi:hypothetical protein
MVLGSYPDISMPKIIDDQGRLRLDANYPAMFYPLDLDDHRPTDFAPILYLRPGIRVKDLTISTTTDPLCGSSATTPRRRDPLMLHLREVRPVASGLAMLDAECSMPREDTDTSTSTTTTCPHGARTRQTRAKSSLCCSPDMTARD